MNIWDILVIIAVFCIAVLAAIIAKAWIDGSSPKDKDNRMHDIAPGRRARRAAREHEKKIDANIKVDGIINCAKNIVKACNDAQNH